MLLPIKKVSCYKALEETFKLQKLLMEWLCGLNRSASDLTAMNLNSLHHDQIIGNWLQWLILKQTKNKLAAELILNSINKQNIIDWYHSTIDFEINFNANQSQQWANIALSCNDEEQNAIQTILQSFYILGFDKGLPFDETGYPSDDESQKINRKKFVEKFKNENNKKVCSYCDGELSNIQTDHWISEGKIPSLSIHPLNLVPSCGECNSASNKGQKSTYDLHNSINPFEEWFHPYLNQAVNKFKLQFNLNENNVNIIPIDNSFKKHFDNLEILLNLKKRWSDDFDHWYDLFLEISSDYVKYDGMELDDASLQNWIKEKEKEIKYGKRIQSYYFVKILLCETILSDKWFFEKFKEGIQRAQLNE